jgi:son of sevenless
MPNIEQLQCVDGNFGRFERLFGFPTQATLGRMLRSKRAMTCTLNPIGTAPAVRLTHCCCAPQMLPPKYLESFQALQALCSSEQNYKQFRAHIRSVELPCIPYLGMYLTDLTFIEDGNPNTHGNLINFFKRQLVSEVISNIQQYQQTPYNLEPVKFLQFWLMNIKTLDKERCYEMSLQILPRGNKVENLSSWNTPAAYRTATEAKKQADDLVVCRYT